MHVKASLVLNLLPRTACGIFFQQINDDSVLLDFFVLYVYEFATLPGLQLFYDPLYPWLLI